MAGRQRRVEVPLSVDSLRSLTSAEIQSATQFDKGGSVNKSRPWPVYVLVLGSLIGLAWGAVVDPDRTWWDLAGMVLTVWITYSLWVGKSWAFTLSFMAATLCAGLVLVIAGIQVFLFEQQVQTPVLWALGSSAVWIVLLLHPATKEFAGLRHIPEPQSTTTRPSPT